MVRHDLLSEGDTGNGELLEEDDDYIEDYDDDGIDDYWEER
jgi:hypothetical protein